MKAIGFLTAALTAAVGLAQQTPSDRFVIALSHPVTIGHAILAPGSYSVEPLTLTGGDAPVLSISSIGANYSLKFRTSAMVVPTRETLQTYESVQPETRVLLRRIGRRYYFDKIWVKGQEYGYQFPLPKGLKGRGTEVE